MFWAFTKSKSTNELASGLETSTERYTDNGGNYDEPKVWFVDNVHAVSNFLKHGNKEGTFSGFERDGSQLLVLADPFHAL